ncbi:hypothetical protein [Chiayiivirga flava]|uniref:Uncharacterized protein n=1 Tax=Chiayiivirga flava TaxID=659595 RepID=A0A7W8DBG6_9GAMM|nr:hypothetical protein [Chiayiivirga flava]MBB5209643.1 hypothetical protein [Chiayiivirga flava]
MALLKTLALVSILVLSANPQPVLAARSAPDDVAALREVVEAYRLSILKKDKAAFLAFFISDKPDETGVRVRFIDRQPLQNPKTRVRVRFLSTARRKPGSKPGSE